MSPLNYSRKAVKAMAKEIVNLDGSDPRNSEREGQTCDITKAERDARYDLAFGHITEEEFKKLQEKNFDNTNTETSA